MFRLTVAKACVSCAVLATSLIVPATFTHSPDSALEHTDIVTSKITNHSFPSSNQSHVRQVPIRHRYDWPTGQPVKVIQPFSVGKYNWLPGHRGVDLDITQGKPIYAPAAGTIIYSGVLNDRQVISILHDDGIRTTYEPVIPAVVKGQRVQPHEIIGTVDGTHCAPSSCLHWGAKQGKNHYLNPLFLLEGPIVLLK
nr:M23 family metallopeptidase [Arcanobacterium phocae]